MESKTEVRGESVSDDVIHDLSSNDCSTQTSPADTVQESIDIEKDEADSKEKLINSIAEVFNFDTTKLTDVDKFKRRLIRSIARSMFVEKIPEEQMWAKLRKDTDCDCYMLWKRMRVLTLKKLKRLLSAEDRLENITKVARLTLTDWLLFDLVLVHEKVDFIGQDNTSEQQKEPKVLSELFELVKKYHIELLDGKDLIKAWVYLTLEYNRRGRQCSPMLLQRRWYQMKQIARIKFYNFWFAYGGAAVKLEKAWQQKPTDLQAAIAKRYKFIVTEQFPEWEELVSKKKVILREDFENLTIESPASNKNVSDVLIIETPVETINVDEDSDAENETPQIQNKIEYPDTDIAVLSKSNDDEPEIKIDKIKREATEEITTQDELTDVQDFETMHIPVQSNNKFDSNMLCSDEIESEVPHNEVLPKITSVTGGVELIDTDDDCDDALITLPIHESNESNMEASQNITTTVNNPENVCTSELPKDDAVNSDKDLKHADDKPEYDVRLDDLLILDDGIALEDDGIELNEEDEMEDLITNIKPEPEQYCNEENKGDEISESPKFDFKLLLTPVVYTKKLDDMDVFKFIDFNSVRDVRIIECSYNESKPIIVKKEKIETTTIEDTSEELQCDKKECVKEESIEDAYEEDSNSSECVNDLKKVKYSSWLLQKPKNRTYNPIQLCKNPDFNTRLKRLSAGFLSCEKNRLMLKECKRMTIDLHKTFETKLIDGKMYLKNSKFTHNLGKIDNCTQELNVDTLTSQTNATKVSLSNIVPIISPTNTHQNLVKNEVPLQVQNDNANNLTDTCQSNKKLLTVEITPIKANNIDYKPPVEIVADNNANHTEQDQDIVNLDQTTKKVDNCDTSDVFENTVSGLQEDVEQNTASIDLDEVSPTVVRRINKHRFQNLLGKTLINGPKNYRFGYPMNSPSQIPVTWNTGPKAFKNSDVFGDVLLASDTLEKMLLILSNQIIDDKRKKKKRKMIEMKQGEKLDDQSKPQEIKKQVTIIEYKSVKQTNASIDNKIVPDTEIATKQSTIKKRGKRKKEVDSKDVSHVKSPQYCCWALEKLLTNENPKEPHYCPKPICICCCRDRLLEKSLRDRQEKAMHQEIKTGKDKRKIEKPTQNIAPASKKLKSSSLIEKNDLTSDPIVLSDDDDDENKMGKNLETNTNNVYQNPTESQNNTHSNVVVEKTSNISGSLGKDNIKSTSQIPENLQINTLETSIVKDTTLTSQSNDNGSTSASCITRVRYANNEKCSAAIVNKQGPVKSLPQNTISQHYNLQNTEYIKQSVQYNGKELHSSFYKNHDSLYAAASKTFKEPLMLSESDTYLRESLMKNSLLSNNNPKIPIFLGKNKILLCSNNASPKSPTKAGNTINEGSQEILPPGVQIVLLPSGELALSIEPGINFSPDEITKLSEILTAVQQQLNESGENISAMKNSEVLNIDIESAKNTENDNKSLSENENIFKSQSSEQTPNCTNSSIEVESVTNSVVQNSKDESSAYLPNVVPKDLDTKLVSATDTPDEIKEDSCNTQEIANDVQIDPQISENSTDSTAQNNKKSILSDLMEMSGISECDECDNICDDKIQINASKECTLTSVRSLPIEPITRNNGVNVICTDHINSNHTDIMNKPVVYKALEKRKELTIVSSFAELKDCHDKSYQFYKMDIETGQILPINLKIKKGISTTKRKRNLNQLVDPKCVIDLTDDQVNVTEETTTSSEPEMIQNINTRIRIKPIKLIRSIRSKDANRNKYITLQSFQPDPLIPRKDSKLVSILKQKISAPLVKTNTASDLNNAAVTKNDSNEKTIDERHESIDSDSDSDDEPLAKKALRKRENDTTVSEINAVSPRNSIIEENVEDEETEYLIPEFLEPVDCEENDDESEDCILGV